MTKIIFALLLVTFLISTANCNPNGRNQLSNEIQLTKTHTLEFSKTRNNKVCKVEFRFVPKLFTSFSTDFMMFKKPTIVCYWLKKPFEETTLKTTTSTARTTRTTTAQPLTTAKLNLCKFHIGYTSLFNFCKNITK